MRRLRPTARGPRRTMAYWPHGGLALGMSLNIVGVLIGGDLGKGLIATANNLLILCGLLLAQKRRNDRRDD